MLQAGGVVIGGTDENSLGENTRGFGKSGIVEQG